MPRTQWYVDQDSGSDANGGTGTGDAWLTVNYALSASGVGSWDTSGGDIIHVKGSGTLTSTPVPRTAIGSPGFQSPLVIKGYGSTPEDGVRATINVGAYSMIDDASMPYTFLADLNLIGDGTSITSKLGSAGGFINCKFSRDGSGTAAAASAGATTVLANNLFQDMGTAAAGVLVGSNSYVFSNAFIDQVDYTNSPTVMLSASNATVVLQNIVKIISTGNVNGIGINDFARVDGCSIWCNGGTGAGISLPTVCDLASVLNCRVEGFSGTGGIGIELLAAQAVVLFVNNKFSDCATSYTTTNFDNAVINEGNEDASGSNSLFTDVSTITDDWTPTSVDFSEEAYPNSFGGF